MKREQLAELLIQSLEHEKGGVNVYAAAPTFSTSFVISSRTG